MFKGQPKGLFVLALANMGERFGYYTMLAIFVLYMQAKFGFSTDTTSTIFGAFLAAVYFLPIFGGLLADKVLGYGRTITLGIFIMFAGYLLLAVPSGTDSTAMIMMFGALLLIAMGTGCFKGNLQALVGNLYDNPKYASKRDLAYSIFYMCINVGAFFAPSAAEGVSNYFMQKDSYTYNASVPALYHQLDRREITPQAYVTLAHYAKGQNIITYDEALLARFAQPDTTVAETLSVESVFSNVLTGDQCRVVEDKLDQQIVARFSAFMNKDSLCVDQVKQTVLSKFVTVTDSTNMHNQIRAHIQSSSFDFNNALSVEKVYDNLIGKQLSVLTQVNTVLNSYVNEELATAINSAGLLAFSASYTSSMSTSFNYGFGVACFSLIVSIFIFLAFRRTYAKADLTEKQKEKLTAQGKGDQVKVIELTPAQVRERLVALGLIFFVVIFFWMAFHQNGLTMTFFARDYTQTSVSGVNRFGFSLLTLLPFAVMFYGILNIFQGVGKGKVGGLVATVIGGCCAYWAYSSFPTDMAITPQIFQQFNAYFIVILTPVAVAFFSWLNKKGKEPLAPRKIGIGMLIAALGFVVLVCGSIGLPSPATATALGGVPDDLLVSPNWLISTYLVLTIAELFLSPMGISFVSKVAPPKYKGLAQGGWLAATAIGNYLVAVVGYLWGGLPLWSVWGLLVLCCLLSAAFLFSRMKKLEKTTKEA